MTNETLEEIFWKNKKFLNSKNKKVKPEPIGLPRAFIGLKKDKILQDDLILEKDILETKGQEINAYSKKIYLDLKELRYYASIQFYKI